MTQRHNIKNTIVYFFILCYNTLQVYNSTITGVKQMSKKTDKKMSKADKEKLMVRIVAGIMGGLMLFGTAALILQMF